MDKNRLPEIDNAKGALMLLVVFGHLIETKVHTHSIAENVYLAIYSFHMPLFVFLSGMLSKSEFTASAIRSSVVSILVPLVVFQAIYCCLGVGPEQPIQLRDALFVPRWILWYLWSLLCWRMALPYFTTIRFPFLLSVAISLLSGFQEDCGYFLGISRTLVFFPFFLAGHFWGMRLFKQIQLKRNVFQIICIVTLSGFILDACFSKQLLTLDTRWLYGSFSYHELQMLNWQAPCLRLGLGILAVLGGVSFLSLIPKRESSLGFLGKASLVIYLWHVLLLPFFEQKQLLDLYIDSPLLGLLVDAFIAMTISACLGNQIVTGLTARMLETMSGVLLSSTKK